MRSVYWAVGGCLVLLVAVVLLAAFGISSLFDWSSPLLFSQSKSPANVGSVDLVTDNSSFAGSTAWVYIRDTNGASGRPQLAGSYASDADEKMRGAVWSKDGSVVAVRADVGQSAGHGFEGSHQSLFVAAYDYGGHRFVPEGPTLQTKSAAIARLLRKRGGEGKSIFRTPYDASGEPMSRQQLQEYKELQELNR
jgi:hypothetical protein